MWKWSIERKVLLALAGSALLPACLYALYVLLRELTLGTSLRSPMLTSALALAVVAILLGLGVLLAHVYVEVKKHHDLEQRLHATNRFLESLLDNIPTMIFAKDAKDLRFLHFNRAGEQLLGYQRGELIGKTDRDFFPPEQVEFFMNKDREVLAQGDVVDIAEEEIDTRSGKRILHTRKVPVRDARGEPLLLLGISMDITQRKANEQRILALVDELQRHSTMLESSNQELESFCYSVSHDLRSPLRAINGYASLLQQQFGPQCDAAALRCLQRICHASERMARLIDDLLEFSRLGRQTLTTSELDMNAIVSRILDDMLVQREAPAPTIQVEDLLPAQGDRHMLQRVWTNLLDNALKYSAGAPDARITAGSTRRGSEVVYLVRDNGVGFDMQYYEKIFGVFQRLHGADEFPGTGVGLAIVHRILMRHGGQVWAESVPGKGATFYFSLPAVREGVSAAS
jgi:PAS domain S-box-containing protein